MAAGPAYAESSTAADRQSREYDRRGSVYKLLRLVLVCSRGSPAGGKVGSGVDKQRLPTILDQHRRPCTPVVRVSRTADRAVTADGWHAHGRAAAQYRQCRLHRSILLYFYRRIGCRQRRRGQRVRDFHVSHAQFVQTVLQKVFFRRSQVALCLFRNRPSVSIV